VKSVCSILTSLADSQQDITPSNTIHTYDAKDISELLKSHCQEFMFGHPVKIERQSTTAVEKAEKPKPEYDDRTMTVLNFSGGL